MTGTAVLPSWGTLAELVDNTGSRFASARNRVRSDCSAEVEFWSHCTLYTPFSSHKTVTSEVPSVPHWTALSDLTFALRSASLSLSSSPPQNRFLHVDDLLHCCRHWSLVRHRFLEYASMLHGSCHQHRQRPRTACWGMRENQLE